MTKAKKEGFWFNWAEPHLPMPAARATPWKGASAFIDELERLQDKASVVHFKGQSTCRICGKANGSQTFSYRGWEWPSGYLHYIKDHNVRPSPEFSAFVLEDTIKDA